MNRFVSCLLLFLSLGYLTSARDVDFNRFEVTVGVGLPSSNTVSNVTDVDKNFSSNGHMGDRVSQIYSDYHSDWKTAFPVSASFSYNVARWFAVGADVTLSAFSAQRHDGMTHELKKRRDNTFVLMVMPQLKFTYYQNDVFGVYSGLAVGAGYFAEKKLNDVRDSVALQAQLTIAGIRVGGKVFGFAECGMGNLYSGLRVGAGYRF